MCQAQGCCSQGCASRILQKGTAIEWTHEMLFCLRSNSLTRECSVKIRVKPLGAGSCDETTTGCDELILCRDRSPIHPKKGKVRLSRLRCARTHCARIAAIAQFQGAYPMPFYQDSVSNDAAFSALEEAPPQTLRDRLRERSKPLILHPAIFISAFMLIGLLFALQQWIEMRIWYPQAPISILIVCGAWMLQYFVWGVFCWSLWFWLGPRLRKLNWKYLVFRLLPVSIMMSFCVEVALVTFFPQFPRSERHIPYLKRLNFEFTSEFLENLAVFWSAFLVFRMLGYYEDARLKERALSQLSVELAQAQMQALRMQVNPHFLFNTMNGISSLMHSNVDAADEMLEQLSSMLRITLERGSAQLITLREEIEFIEMYLSLQDRRFSGRIHQRISIEPQLHDALVPTMILQPLVENAFVHGFSKIAGEGKLEIQAIGRNRRLRITVRNDGAGLRNLDEHGRLTSGTGLNNIRNRLQLLFDQEQSLNIRETTPNVVQVDLSFPLKYSDVPEKILFEYGPA
ncbi:MAG: histidine kinase [Acidobacteriota bacterium]|nr:histidine kinase [Acidobacteriota bacterium]